jgi:outer membrane protein
MKNILYVLIFSVALSLSAHVRAKVVTLAHVINRAKQTDATIKQSNSKSQEMEYKQKSIRGRFLPYLEAQGNILLWNDTAGLGIDSIDFEGVDLQSLPAPIPEAFQRIADRLGEIIVREKITSQLSVSLIQPLTPLYKVFQAYKAADTGTEIAKYQHQLAVRKIIYDATVSYFQLAKVKELSNVTNQAVETILAHVNRAKDFEAEGLIHRSDVLAAEVELSNAKETQVKTEQAIKMTEALLRKYLNESYEDIQIDPLNSNVPAKFHLSLNKAKKYALIHRFELKALDCMQEVFKRKEKIAKWDLMPNISMVGKYEHVEGIELQPENSLFVGAVLDWKFWDFGHTFYNAKASEKATQAVSFKREDVEQLIQLEVTQRYLAYHSALERVGLLEKAVENATETLRIKKLHFAENTVPSTDVLDAQTRLMAAQGNLAAARTDVWISLAALHLALGGSYEPSVLKEYKIN